MTKGIRYTRKIIQEYFARGYWLSTTLSELWDKNAAEMPGKEAIADGKTRLTWKTAKQWIDRLALGFLEFGLKKDDLLLVQLPGSIEYCLIRVACEKAGLLCMPLLTSLRDTEVKNIVSLAAPVGIVVPWEFRGFNHVEMLERLHLTQLKHTFVVGDKVPPLAISVKNIVNTPYEKKYASEFLKGRCCQSMDVSLVLHTTGTTGFPKLVEHPICCRLSTFRIEAQRCKLTSNDIIAVIGPAPAGPNGLAYFGAPQVGAKVIILERFEAEEVLRLIEREKVTILGAVPAQLALLLQNPNFEKYKQSSLRLIWCSGAPLPYAIAIEAEKRFGCMIHQGYGTVDTGGISSTSLDDPVQVRLKTVGKLLDGNEVKLLDEDQQETGSGEIGEICVKGPHMSSGFFKDPETTRNFWTRDGWARTGDLGRFDEHDNLMIVGRTKDMIIRGGQNIYPTEIENILSFHPRISGVAIVGMPDETMGERACAYVVTNKDQRITFEEMIHFLKQKGLANYKLPERLEIVNSLPKAGDGQKVDKKVLQNDIRKKLNKAGWSQVSLDTGNTRKR